MTARRLDIQGTDSAAYRAVLGMEAYVRSGGVEKSLLELLKVRASQLNGCGFCLDLHNRDAVNRGEDPRRLYVLAAWREAPQLYTDRERAALALAEAVTLIARGGVSDEVWAGVTAHFDDREIVQLLMATATINVWNRLAVSTHQALPGVTEN